MADPWTEPVQTLPSLTKKRVPRLPKRLPTRWQGGDSPKAESLRIASPDQPLDPVGIVPAAEPPSSEVTIDDGSIEVDQKPRADSDDTTPAPSKPKSKKATRSLFATSPSSSSKPQQPQPTTSVFSSPPEDIFAPSPGTRQAMVGTDDISAPRDVPQEVLITTVLGNKGGIGAGLQEDEEYQQPLRKRVCYCCLVIPFFFAFCVSAMSAITLAIKNEEIKGKCEISCLLSDSSSEHQEWNCWIVWGAGGVVCVVSLLFILSLVIRLCHGTKL